MENLFSRLFGKPRQKRTANDSAQKTDAYRQITWRIILQPDFTQSHDYKTLTRRAQLVCDTQDSLRDENKYLERVFYKKNYNADFIRWTIYRPTEADATNSNPTPVTTVTIPYLKGIPFFSFIVEFVFRFWVGRSEKEKKSKNKIGKGVWS